MTILRTTSMPHVGLILLLLTATLGAVKLADNRRPEPLALPLESLPMQIAGFSAADQPPLTESVLGQLKPTAYLSRVYRNQDLSLDLFVAFYARQRAGESMHSPKHCLPGGGWDILNYGSAAIPAASGDIQVNNYSIDKEGHRLAVIYWYQSRNRIIASEYKGKVLLAQDALMRNSTAGSIVRLTVPDQPAAVEAARGFAAALIPLLQRCFGN